MSNQLFRTKKNAILGGVCEGLAEYLRLDVLWVRVYFFLLVLATGLGFLVYLALWVIMPREDHLPSQGSNGVPQPDDFAERFKLIGEEIRQLFSSRNPQLLTYIGVGMILLGAFSLLELLPNNWWDAFKTMILWPALLISAGVVIILRATRGEK
jgi:phage shock protein PspC (stress-responsive transcriptional regulator)